MDKYSIGDLVQSRHGGGILIVVRTLYDQALATTDGKMLSGNGWCQHRDRQVGHFEYFGGSNEGAHGILDIAQGCHRAIDQSGPEGRFHGRPDGLDFDW